MTTVTRYVSTTGNDGLDGTTLVKAWRTIAHAAAVVNPGTVVKIQPGTYVEAIAPSKNGSNSATGFRYEDDPSNWLLFEADGGVVMVDGTANRGCFLLYGNHHIRIQGISMKNAGASFTTASCGVEIQDASPFNATAAGAHHIELVECNFADIDRPSAFPTTGYGSPVTIYGHADTRLGGTPVHHISIQNCIFRDSLMSNTNILHSHVSVAGNVHDVEIVFNEVIVNRAADHPGQLSGDVSTFQGGFELSGNQLPGAYPDQPRQMVVSDNIWTGNEPGGDYSIYFTACSGVIAERNYLVGSTWGFGVVAERGTNPGLTCDKIFLRNNIIFDPGLFAIVAGAFANNADGYDTVTNIWAVNNTFRRTSTQALIYSQALIYLISNNLDGATHGVAGIAGESYIGESIFLAEDDLLYYTLPSAATDMVDRNLWGSSSSTPFVVNDVHTAFPYLGTQDTHGVSGASDVALFDGDGETSGGFRLLAGCAAADIGSGATPSWLVDGLFGDYLPTIGNADFYGVDRVQFDAGASAAPAGTGVIFPQTEDGEIIDVSAGGTGHIVVTKDAVTFQGASAAETIINAGGAGWSSLVTLSGTIRTVTFADITFDNGDNSALSSVVRCSRYYGIEQISFVRCRFLGYTRDAAAVVLIGRRSQTDTAAKMKFRDCYFSGDGLALESSQGADVECRGMRVVGGAGLLSVVADDFPSTNIVANDIQHHAWFWAAPASDVLTVSSFTSNTAVVTGYDITTSTVGDVARVRTPRSTFTVGSGHDDSSSQLWDRAETADGRWTQVFYIDPVSGRITFGQWRAAGSWRPIDEPIGVAATLYRVTIGLVRSAVDGGATQTISLSDVDAPDGVWREVTGGADDVPSTSTAGTVLEICRAGTDDRVLDGGSILLTADVNSATLAGLSIEGAYGYGISSQGATNDISHAVVRLTSGPCVRNDGDHTWSHCTFEKAGTFAMAHESGVSHLVAPVFDAPGTQDDGSDGEGYAIGVTAGSRLPIITSPVLRNGVTGLFKKL